MSIATRTLQESLAMSLPDVQFFIDKDRCYHMEVTWMNYCCASKVENIENEKLIRRQCLKSVFELCEHISKNKESIMKEL